MRSFENERILVYQLQNPFFTNLSRYAYTSHYLKHLILPPNIIHFSLYRNWNPPHTYLHTPVHKLIIIFLLVLSLFSIKNVYGSN